jgi:hypothetical protein
VAEFEQNACGVDSGTFVASQYSTEAVFGLSICASVPILTTEQFRQFEAWLSVNGELCIDLYAPKSGSGGNQYFVRSVDDLEKLVGEQTRPQLVVTVFRRLQYPLRGVADLSLLDQALREIPDGQWYTFVVLENHCYPNRPSHWGSGNSHSEFRREFSEILGRPVGIGRNPFDYDSWIQTHPDEATVMHFQRQGDHYKLEPIE